VPNTEVQPMSHPLAAFDARIDKLIDPLRKNPHANRVFYAASALADHSLIWLILASLKAVTQEETSGIKAAIGIGAESLIVNIGVKSLFGRARPIEADHSHPHQLRYPLTSSFPSGHASAAFAAAMIIGKRPWSRIAMFGLATVVSTSRVHVRIHHASDVVAGAGLGVGLGWALSRLLERSQKPLE